MSMEGVEHISVLKSNPFSKVLVYSIMIYMSRRVNNQISNDLQNEQRP